MKAMRLNMAAAAFAACFSFGSIVAHAAPGDLDTIFGTGGIVTTQIQGNSLARAIAHDSKGRLLVAGVSTDLELNRSVPTLARYLPDGTLDTAFGDGGSGIAVATPPDGLGDDAGFNSVAVDSKDRVVAAGYVQIDTPTGPQDIFTVVRFDADGMLDASFGERGFVETVIASGEVMSDAYSLAIDATGRIVAGGDTVDASFQDTAVIVRFNEDGGLDHTFASSGIATLAYSGFFAIAQCVSFDNIGRIVAAGIYPDPFSSVMVTFVARYSDSGDADTSFGSDSSGSTVLDALNVSALAIDDLDRPIVGGLSNADTVFALQRLDAEGNPDASFGSDGSGFVTTTLGDDGDYSGVTGLAIDDAGNILAGGNFNPASGASTSIALARYTSDGMLDDTFGDNGVVYASAEDGSVARGIVLDASNDISIAGYSTTLIDGTTSYTVVRIEN